MNEFSPQLREGDLIGLRTGPDQQIGMASLSPQLRKDLPSADFSKTATK
jgi:hypothetical protein